MLFCFSNVGVSGADDFINARNAFGSVSKSGNGLCAANLKNAVDACNLSSGKNNGIHFAVLTGRGYHNDLAATRDFGRDRVHQNGGGISRRTAGNVKTCTVNGNDFLSYHNTVFVVDDKAIANLTLVERANVFGSCFENLQEFGFYRGYGFFDFLGGYREGRKLCAVEFFTVFIKRGISVFAYVCDNFRNNALYVNGRFGARKNLVVCNFTVFENANHGFSPPLAAVPQGVRSML